MNQVTIGKFIAELRHESKLTQETLAHKIGVSNKTISRWENGNYMPDIEMMQILSKEFHVSINELLCGKRLDESDFGKNADKKVDKRALNAYHFSNITVITVSIILYIAFDTWIIGICPLAFVVLYAILRNLMMTYVECRVYGQ